MAWTVRMATCLAACLVSLAAAAQGKPILIGAALSQTGFLADLAAGARDALLLWQDGINAAGGLLGRRVEMKIYDDASEASRSARLCGSGIVGSASSAFWSGRAPPAACRSTAMCGCR